MSRDPEILDLGRAAFAPTHERMLRIAAAVRKGMEDVAQFL